ncbi:MAG: L-serine ammonia-lyase, iron-sulfur-dependent subunit beta, partial [Eggerthellaceae bacterium]|nr:L-serine ammonia-lyase, iron-sulfur-dependent subunit beta [Eggerthellaceae bacterium]
MQTYGLRDIIGPIMVGPSSSHTAGALAISAMARRLCTAKPVSVKFTLYGSFAFTGKGHGTDKALVAGMLGLEADDLGIRKSFELAQEAGMDVEMIFDKDTLPEHPNTVDIYAVDENGESVSVRGVSVGGGAAKLTRINGIDVDVTGERTNVVVHQKDVRGVLAHISSCLARCGINIASASLYRTAKHVDAFTIMEVDDPVDEIARELIMEHPAIYDVRVIQPNFRPKGVDPAAAPIGIEDEYERWNFDDGVELLATCEREGATIAEVFSKREEALCLSKGISPEIDRYLEEVLKVMREAIDSAIEHPEKSTGGLIGGEAREVLDFTKANGALLDPLALDAAINALAVLETNAAMGRIVATPTAGSSGVLPGILFSLQKHRGFDDEKLKEGLLTAAALG